MIFLDMEVPDKGLDKIAKTLFKVLGYSGRAFAEVDFVSADEIRQVNAEFRQIDRATDVLSFPSLELNCEVVKFCKRNFPDAYDSSRIAINIGSILICSQVASEQAAEFGHSERREISYLFLHGLLHLLGYDHIEESDKQIMRSKEEQVLEALEITREDIK